MKKGNKVFSVLSALCLLVSMGTLAACDDPKPSPSESEQIQPSSPADEQKVTITYKNGDTVLKEESVKFGTVLTEWDPTGTVTDEFFGWYAEPTLTHEFDFSSAISEDTVIFGSLAKVIQ